MADPNWNNGFYYDGLPPHTGMKLARRKKLASSFDSDKANVHTRNCYDYLSFWA